MNDEPPKPSRPGDARPGTSAQPPKDEREARLARALRANLRRRKAGDAGRSGE